MSPDSGPYPKRDRQDTLQQLSLKAFQAVLPTDKFLFRDERVDDKGVDGALEVVVNDTFRNCRAQVQLKSTDDGPEKFNKTDGSYSLSVDTSNLNYLMNGPCPLYVIWFSKTNEIRYAWAYDEWQRLDAENPDWQTQDSFTIRFSHVLTASVMDQIRDRILSAARMQRQIHEAVARSAPAEQVVVRIDATTLQPTDPTVQYARLSKNGMTIISSGFAVQALEAFAALNPVNAKEARIQLIAGFAEFSLGKYHAAIGHLGNAAIGRAKLTTEDRQFLDLLRATCDYNTGKIGQAVYFRKLEESASQLTGIPAEERKLEVLRRQRLSERDMVRRAALLDQIRTVVNGIVASPDALATQKLQARLILLTCEGNDLNTQWIQAGSRITMRNDLGLETADLASNTAESAKKVWAAWQERAQQIQTDAVELGHPLLIADAIAARAGQYAALLFLGRLDSVMRGKAVTAPPAIVAELVKDADIAVSVYAAAGSIEGEVRVKLLVAELYEAGGESDKAKAIAEEVLPIAEAMDYQHHVARAKSHLEGATRFAQFAKEVEEKRPLEQDVFFAMLDDNSLRSMAETYLDASQAPSDRLPQAMKQCVSMRRHAQERVNWCRHLDVILDARHLSSSATAFLQDVGRVCVCVKHRYQSPAPSTSDDAVIDAFKAARCAGCSDKSPLSAG